ncbi:hypothetical protein [Inquilinus sp. CAU 1745]|uniref:hypothetical protein n=1 Tax=Inquilinus sp. CAU 1745 TaxID=3140369 RepID=UPI00325A9473
MTIMTKIPGLLITAAAAFALSACADLAKPGEELWPYGYEDTGLQDAGAAGLETIAENGPAYLARGSFEGRPAIFVGNRHSARTIVVVYQLDGGSVERLRLAPGARAPVSTTAGGGRLIAVM